MQQTMIYQYAKATTFVHVIIVNYLYPLPFLLLLILQLDFNNNTTNSFTPPLAKALSSGVRQSIITKTTTSTLSLTSSTRITSSSAHRCFICWRWKRQMSIKCNSFKDNASLSSVSTTTDCNYSDENSVPIISTSLRKLKVKRKRQNAIVVLDPLTEWRDVVQAIKSTENSCQRWDTTTTTTTTTTTIDDCYDDTSSSTIAIAIVYNPLSGRDDDISKFIPTSSLLYAAGFDHVLEEPLSSPSETSSVSKIFSGFDVYSYVQILKRMEQTNNYIIRGVVPLSETAVEYSDTLSALLGLQCYNDLGTVLARRDKGFMKQAVAKAGLKVARFERISSVEEVCMSDIVTQDYLAKGLPIVVKTPQGFSSTDVYICREGRVNEVEGRVSDILQSGMGPDCRKVDSILLEEYISGDEIAVNIIASPMIKGKGTRIVVTDVWKYGKTITNGLARYDRADIMDPNDSSLCNVIKYAKGVAEAVGICYGMGHVELKATYSSEQGCYTNPVMIEVGARLSGGRKATMTKAALLPCYWNPFESLIRAHCGLCLNLPKSFTPKQFVRHIFLPYNSGGRVIKISHCDFESCASYHSHFILASIGDFVKKTTDIVTCSGFVWLIGEKSVVDADTQFVLQNFEVVIDETRL